MKQDFDKLHEVDQDEVNKRERTREELRLNEEKFELIAQSTLEAIFIIDKTGHCVFFNDGLASVLGYKAGETIGYSFTKFVPVSEIPKYLVQMKNIFMNRDVKDFQTLIYHKDGHPVDVEINARLTRFKGELVGQGTIRDISERKRVEKALRESEMKYRILAEKMHDVVWILDLDLKLVYVSPSTEWTLGFTPEERMSMRIDECMVPESLDYAMQVLINEAVSNQEGTAGKDRGILLELEYYHKNGNTCWLEQSINGIYDEKGELSGIMGVARDITERRKAQDALQQSAVSYRGLFNSVTDAIYVLDHEGKFLDVNEGAMKMYGYPHAVLVGKDPSFVSADGMNDLEGVAVLLNRAYHGEKQQFEFWGKRSNGEFFLKDVRLYPGIYFGNKVVVAMAQDITLRKQQETILKNKVEELQQANQLLIAEEQLLTSLKKEVNELLVKLGKPDKYSLQ